MKSNMTLYVEDGARLIGSGRLEDFPVTGCPFEGRNQLCYASLINTDGAPYENIIIDGKGTIDASGAELFASEMKENRAKRGRVVCIRNYFKDITVDTIGGNAIYLYGLPERPFKNIYLENVKAHGKYGMKSKNIDNLQMINVDVSGDGDMTK